MPEPIFAFDKPGEFDDRIRNQPQNGFHKDRIDWQSYLTILIAMLVLWLLCCVRAGSGNA